MKRSPIRRVSKKRAAANAIYTKLRKQFLEVHPWCQWWIMENMVAKDGVPFLEAENLAVQLNGLGAPRATEIHHMKKPKCKYLNDTSTWMAVSRQGHEWIENHKSEAREKGYLFNI